MMHYTLGNISLDKYRAVAETFTCTTHNIHNTQTSMPAAGFETAIPASERTHQTARPQGLTDTNFS